MFMVTTTVRMVNGVHSNTSNDWESLSESFEFVEKNTSFHDWLFISTSSSDNSDSSSTASGNSFSWTWWKSYSDSTFIIRMSNNGGICSSASRVRSFVSNWRFNIANGGTFSNFTDWQDITNGYCCFSATENILAWVSSFSCKEILCSVFVSVRVSELNFKKWGTSSWIMNYRSNNSLDIALSFSEIKITISGGSNSFWFRGSVNASWFTFSLA